MIFLVIFLVYILPMLIVGWVNFQSVYRIYRTKNYMDWYYDFHRPATQGILAWRIFAGVIFTFVPIVNIMVTIFILFDYAVDRLSYFFGDWWRKPL